MLVRPFVAVDLDGFEGMHQPNEAVLDQIDSNTLSIVERDTGQVLAIVGYNLWWEGVGSVWAHLSIDCKGKGIRFIRAVRRSIDIAFKKGNLRKMITMIFESDHEAVRWSKPTGWTLEGILEGASPDGSNLRLYSINRG